MDTILNNNENLTACEESAPSFCSDPSETRQAQSEQEPSLSEILVPEEVVIEPQEPATLGVMSSVLKSDLKAQVEAILFITDTPLKTGQIAKMLNAPYDDIQAALVQLIQEYEDRNCGLEIGTDDGYLIQVRTQYLNIVTDMMPLELNPGPLRTLSAIALKEPILQAEIVNMRGSGAYDHINELVELDLITKKPQGLSYILRTTKKFSQYFRLTKDASQIKGRLQEEAKKLQEEKENKENKEKEADCLT